MAGSLTIGRQPSPFQRGTGRGINLGAGGVGGGNGDGVTGPPSFGVGRTTTFVPMGTEAPRDQGVLTPQGMRYGNFNRSVVGNTMTGAGGGYSGGGGVGRHGGIGSPFPGRPRIGSAAGALGSGGIPTSVRGRLEKFGPEAAMAPTWQVSEAVRNNGGGLSQTGGLPPALTPQEQARTQLMTDAGNFQAVQQAPGVNYGGAPRKIDPLTGLSRYGKGTGIGRGVGRPIPWNQPFVAGDAKKGSNKPNEEIILPTPDGIHVIPVDDLPQLGEGTVSVKDAGQDKRPLKKAGLKPPINGLAEFEKLNPNTPSAASQEAVKLLMNPKLPLPIRMPAASHGTGLKKYATGTKSIDPQAAVYAMYGGTEPAMPPSALSTITGQPDFKDGEIRQDSAGNSWRYDGQLGHGLPMNPYLDDPVRPMPIPAFKATASQRYNDLADRLSGLRQQGMSAGRARVAAVQAQQQQQEASQRLPASEVWRTNLPGGGQSITGRYGRATIGQNLPKSFTVERMDGTSGRFNNLADASAESAADAAQRHVRGLPMNVGRGIGAGVPPTAIEELTGVVEPESPPFMAPAPYPSRFISTLPDDRPSTVESRCRAWGIRPTLRPMTLNQAKTRGREALVRRAADLGTNLQTAFDRELVQPVRDFGTNAQTAWDLLTQ